MAARIHPAKQKVDGTFKKSKLNKYNAKGRKIDGLWFASKAEGDRYEQLKEMVERGTITQLETQVAFPLRVKNILIATYRADFTYRDKHRLLIVEDVKGMLTPEYKLKKKLMFACYDIKIAELPGKSVPRARFLTATEAMGG